MVEFFNNLASADPGRILLVWVVLLNLGNVPLVLGCLRQELSTGVIFAVLSFLDLLWSFFIHYIVYMAIVWLSNNFAIYPESFSAYAILTILVLMRKPKSLKEKLIQFVDITGVKDNV